MVHLEGHPFAVKEKARWLASARAGRLFVFCEPDPVAFAALGTVDGGTHLEQLAVRRAWMRRGLGRMLVSHVMQWKPLTLTTYDHLPYLASESLARGECDLALASGVQLNLSSEA